MTEFFERAGTTAPLLEEFTDIPGLSTSVCVPPGSRVFAERRSDGFALGVVASNEDVPDNELPRVDALVLVRPSKTLNDMYADAYIPTTPLPVNAGKSIADELSTVNPRWKTLQSRTAIQGTSLIVHVQCEGGVRRQVCIPETALGHLGGDFVGEDGLTVSVTVDEENRSVSAVLKDVNGDTVLGSASTDSSFYSTLMQQHMQGNYVHGLRSVVGRVRGAHQWNPTMNNVNLPQHDLSPQQTVSLVRNMGLQCSRPEFVTGMSSGLANKLLQALGITPYQPGQALMGSKAGSATPLSPGMSVYPMLPSVVSPHVVPPSMLRFLRQQGVCSTTATALLAGAYAVHNNMVRGLLPSPQNENHAHRAVVDLRVMPSQKLPASPVPQVMELITKLREKACPTYFMRWDSANIGVHVVRQGAKGGGVVFQSTFSPVPSKEETKTRYEAHRQTPMSVFAVYNLTGPSTMEAQQDRKLADSKIGNEPLRTKQKHPWPGLVSAEGLAASAMRLAVIDTVASLPQYAPLQHTLRRLWLEREQGLITKDPEYFQKVSVLMQLSGLPRGVNFWATVPYVPG
jgi:hypothetical protein